MGKYSFTKTSFLFSSFTKEKPLTYPAIGFVGKSNVGKSSLINHLCRKKKLAFTSSCPGKTQIINFFLIDDSLLLLDFPGYGYAKVSKAQKQQWQEKLEQFLQNEKDTLSLLLLLVDCRRELSEEDKQFITWAQFHHIPVIVVITKTDKLPTSSLQKNIQKILASLPKISYITYSVKENTSRNRLIAMINNTIKGKGNG